ncbi:hypothetical protein [Blastococcus sp. SYSU D00820]
MASRLTRTQPRLNLPMWKNMTPSRAAVSVLEGAANTGACPECGVDTAVDLDLRIKPHSGYGGKPAVCTGGGKPAGYFTAAVFPQRPARAPHAVFKEATVRFQDNAAWRTRLTCATCSKVETLAYATFQRVEMPFHGRWVQGNREPCPGGEAAAEKQELITRRTDRSDAIVGIGFVVAIILVCFFALSSCLGDDDPEATASSGDHSTYDSSNNPDDPPSAATPTQDTSIRDYVRAAGVSDQLVRQLGQVAGDTGYGLTRGVPLAFEDAQSFAVVMIDNCRDLHAGTVTVQGMIDRDVSDGAPVADARAMADFLERIFCPAVN